MPKNFVWHKNQVSVQNQIDNFSPWGCPWPPTGQELHPVLHLQINVPENGPKWIPIPKAFSLLPKSSISHDQNSICKFTPWSHPGPPTDPSPCSWHSDWAKAPENGPKWFPYHKTLGLTPKACPEPKIQFRSLKLSMAYFISSTPFLTFR